LYRARGDGPVAMLKVTFVIGTLNEISRLPRAIESIRKQSYPQDLIEILIADGGSTDGTVEYARSAGCVVVHNPLRRCEPGIALGYAAATGDVVVAFAADNRLHDEHFVREIVRPFGDPEVYGAVPRLVSTREDCLTTRYLNDFTDPFNHFLYGDAASPVTFRHKYPVNRTGEGYVVYDFSASQPPLVAMAQGVTVRAGLERRAGIEEDDVAPISDLLERGYKLAYVPNALVEHHTVSSLRDLLSKFGPRIAKRLAERDQPVWQRAQSWTATRRMRAYLWPFYAVSVVLPAIAGFYGAVRDGRLTWLYHPIITFALGVEFWRQVLKWRLKTRWKSQTSLR
jgi:glycosyltransferase involved in cell wall biosynthesis